MPERAPRSSGGRPSALQRLVRLLPPPRVDAAVGILHGTRDLLTGAPPASWTVRADEPPLDPRRMARARRALADGDPREALRAVDEILTTHPEYLPALRLRAAALHEAGELTRGLAALRIARRSTDSAALTALDRLIVGQLRESDPGWLPRIPGPRDPVVPADESRVLHLLPDSPPDGRDPSGIRSLRVIAAQRRAGMDPVALTAPGLPRRAERVSPAAEDLEGSRFHRLDLGEGYPDDVEVDRHLEDVAWMASDIVREERPAVLHAHPGVRGCEIARVGLALRERHGIPVVYEARGARDANSLVPEGKPSSELARRRRAVEVATLAAVDAVVVAESEADDLAALGAEEDRLFLVPDGDATDGALDATVARLADAYAHACGSRRGESGR